MDRFHAGSLISLLVCLSLAAPLKAAPAPGGEKARPSEAAAAASRNELYVTVGKSIVLNSDLPIERIAVGFGDVAQASAVSVREVLVSGKAPGSTSLIVWQEGGDKLVFDVIVRANTTLADARVNLVRRELKRELPGRDVELSLENDTVFLRGSVRNLSEAERAVAIAGTLAKTVNLLYVDVPPMEQQILLKVRFATVDRTASTELGLNLVSTGATNTLGTVSTQQFAQPKLTIDPQKGPEITLTDALNIFFLRPDLNLAGTLRALQRRALLEILAEPNVLAINGKQASFLAGGEYPYPVVQGAATGLGSVTIQFREFGVRLNFLPHITPRGTIRLEVAPEVSALDFTNGLQVQGFTVPALTVRRVNTEIELSEGQSFAIGGLLDRRLTQTFQKIPLLGDVPLLGKLFQSKAVTKDNTELLVIVTPEFVRPMPAGRPMPEVEFPVPLPGTEKDLRTPGVAATGSEEPKLPKTSIPIEDLVRDMREQDENNLTNGTKTSGSNSLFQPQSATGSAQAGSAAAKPQK